MIKLEMTFKTISELTTFLSSKSDVNSATSSAKVSVEAKEEVPSVINEAPKLSPAEKAKITKAKNKAKKEAEAKAAQAMPVEQTAASVMVQNEVPVAPVVEPAPVAETTIDKDAYIAKAQALVGQMKELGVPDVELLPKLQAAYGSVGLAFQKVSELPDAQIPLAVGAMEALVHELKSPAQAQAYI